jgi:hypothetical protein
MALPNVLGGASSEAAAGNIACLLPISSMQTPSPLIIARPTRSLHVRWYLTPRDSASYTMSSRGLPSVIDNTGPPHATTARSKYSANLLEGVSESRPNKMTTTSRSKINSTSHSHHKTSRVPGRQYGHPTAHRQLIRDMTALETILGRPKQEVDHKQRRKEHRPTSSTLASLPKDAHSSAAMVQRWRDDVPSKSSKVPRYQKPTVEDYVSSRSGVHSSSATLKQ